MALTQEALAKELGVTRGAVAQWEGGIRAVRPVYALLLMRIAKERGVAA